MVRLFSTKYFSKLNDMVVHLLINIYQSTKSSLVVAFLKGLDNSSHLS